MSLLWMFIPFLQVIIFLDLSGTIYTGNLLYFEFLSVVFLIFSLSVEHLILFTGSHLISLSLSLVCYICRKIILESKQLLIKLEPLRMSSGCQSLKF